MHPNQAFRKPDAPHNIAFARDRSFGMLALNADPAPMISHIPSSFPKMVNIWRRIWCAQIRS